MKRMFTLHIMNLADSCVYQIDSGTHPKHWSALIYINEKEHHKSVYILHHELHGLICVPPGLRDAPYTFERAMHIV